MFANCRVLPAHKFEIFNVMNKRRCSIPFLYHNFSRKTTTFPCLVINLGCPFIFSNNLWLMMTQTEQSHLTMLYINDESRQIYLERTTNLIRLICI